MGSACQPAYEEGSTDSGPEAIVVDNGDSGRNDHAAVMPKLDDVLHSIRDEEGKSQPGPAAPLAPSSQRESSRRSSHHLNKPSPVGDVPPTLSPLVSSHRPLDEFDSSARHDAETGAEAVRDGRGARRKETAEESHGSGLSAGSGFGGGTIPPMSFPEIECPSTGLFEMIPCPSTTSDAFPSMVVSTRGASHAGGGGFGPGGESSAGSELHNAFQGIAAVRGDRTGGR